MKIFKITIVFSLLFCLKANSQFETLINRNGLTVNIQKSENKIFLGLIWPNKLLFTNNDLQSIDSIIINMLNYQLIEDYCILNDTTFYVLLNRGSYPRSKIIKTTDGGNTWQTILNSNSNTGFTNIRMCDVNKGLITAFKRNNFDIINELVVYHTLNNWQTIDSTSIRNVNDFFGTFQIVNACNNNQFLVHSFDVLTFTNNFFDSITNFTLNPFNYFRSGRIINKDTLLFFTYNTTTNTPTAKYMYSFNGGETFNEKPIPTSSASYTGAINFQNGLFFLSTEFSGSTSGKLLISNDNLDTYDIIELPGEYSYPILEFINDSVALLAQYGKVIIKYDLNTYTSIKKQHKEIGLSIYPNPTNAIVNIVSSKSNINKIEVLDIAGKQIKFNVFQETNQIEENISKYENGIYILKIFLENGEIIINKIVKH